MKLCFLLNDDYTPYWKWLHHEFRRLPEAQALDPLLLQLAREADRTLQAQVVSSICNVVQKRLAEAGLLDGVQPGSLFEWIHALRGRIKDPVVSRARF